jgi:8-oxo-dGTP diphosphatase
MNLADHAHTFCPRCAARMITSQRQGKLRPCCPACGYVQYLNPAPAAAVILMRDRRLCLVRRRFEPRAGMWTLPAGFMEFEEAIQDTAVRETKEETGLDVRLSGLFAVHTGILPPNHPILLVVFRAEEIGGRLRAGDDADRVGFYDLDEPPGDIAFATHRQVLQALRAERG